MNMNKLYWISIISFIASVCCYTVSLRLPALTMSNHFDSCYVERSFGLGLLAIGWAGLIIGQPGWFANIFYFISVLLIVFKSRTITSFRTMLSLAALVTGLTPLTLLAYNNELFIDCNKNIIKMSDRLHVGFYIWILSFVLMAISQWILYYRLEKTQGYIQDGN